MQCEKIKSSSALFCLRGSRSTMPSLTGRRPSGGYLGVILNVDADAAEHVHHSNATILSVSVS